MKFSVPDMTCNHCVQSITKAVHEVSSEAQVVCDLPNHVVEVSDPVSISPERVVSALDDIGFEAKLIEGEA